MTSEDGRPPRLDLDTTYTIRHSRASEPSAGVDTDGPIDLGSPPTAERRVSRNKMIAAGVVGAVALGAVFGLAMQPRTGEPKRAQPTASERAADEQERRQLQIEVTRRQLPPPKIAANAGKIDAAGTVIQPTPAVVPSRPSATDDQAEPARRGGLMGALAGIFGLGKDREDRNPPPVQRQARVAPTPTPQVERIEPRPEPARPEPMVIDSRDADDAGEDDAVYVREEPPAPPPRRYRVARPSFDCRYARTRAENMVCEDPRLAAADRRLAAAFRRAVDSGVPYRALRAQQDRWLAARERAAVSPEAVGMVYEQRIAELEDIGEDGRW